MKIHTSYYCRIHTEMNGATFQMRLILLQYAQIVMVLERSVKKEKLAACQLEYSIRLNEANDAGMEIRGLMVIKQTKKTRARQRKQAITNWKVILLFYSFLNFTSIFTSYFVT